MKRLPLALLFLALRPVGFCEANPEAPGTSLAPKANDVAASAVVTEASATKPARPREVSPDIAAKISATRPKFSPPKNPEAEGAVEAPDLREIDKPLNTILRLPKHIVQARKYPVFKERELLTPEGELDLAYQRYPGLRFGSLSFLTNNRIAGFMLQEELRLERMGEMNDLVGLYQYSDLKSGSALKRVAQKTFMRTGDFGRNGSAIRGEDHGINDAGLYSRK